METFLGGKDNFSDFWFNKLTPRQRKRRIELAFIPIKIVGMNQIHILEKYEKSSVFKEIGFIYFITTLKNTWDNIEFAIEIGKGRFRRFSYYPTRTVLESLLRLEYYCRQKKEGQNKITVRELLRIAKRFYDREKIENQSGEPYRKMYSEVADQGDYPQIEEANSKDDPFPNMKCLSKESTLCCDGNIYFSYEALCELSHGKLLAVTSAMQDEFAEHIRSLMDIQYAACNLIKLVDNHIQGVTKKDVVEALNKADRIIKDGFCEIL